MILKSSSAAIVYPSSDGKRMAENTLQLQWIVLLFGNLDALLTGVFVAADLLWYPVEGHPEITTAPDVMVAFDRPRGHRLSYKQWEEENIPPTVVFEVLSPTNTYREMTDKLLFFEEHGVEEYYELDPDSHRLAVYLRQDDLLRRVRFADTFTSPRLGIRFVLTGKEIVAYRPNGQPFQTLGESERQRSEAEQRAAAAQRLVARLAELSRKARRGQASAEELTELERLEEEAGHS